MKDGFIKIAAAVPKIRLGDCASNAERIIALVEEMAAQGVKLAAFPEMCVTGYSIGSLAAQYTMLDGAQAAVGRIAEATARYDMLFAVGAPVAVGAGIFDCAVVMCRGRILGIVPECEMPASLVRYAGQSDIPFGGGMIFSCDCCDAKVGFEIGEDVASVSRCTDSMVLGGANIIFNLSAGGELVGKAQRRRDLVKAQSLRCLCAYAFVGAGAGESTTASVSAGHCIICENGKVLSEQRWQSDSFITADIDLQIINCERRREDFFAAEDEVCQIIPFELSADDVCLTRHISKAPFIPGDAQELSARCEEILHMQALALAQRMESIGCKKAVIGLSGGLDSTLALLVTARAYDILGIDRGEICCITMPCFGTTSRTYNNACSLARSTGANLREINIADSVRQHLSDIGHDGVTTDVAYENAQARERTQVLMDVANMNNGLVVGTGDLSELALGWATYNGDHMSMYGVNAGVPKTLVRHLVAYTASISQGELRDALCDILDTPVSPELLPPTDGEISQKTENIVGPYELHDFFLYYLVRFGFAPEKIYRLARIAFGDEYDGETIKKWLVTFLRRFMTQQFKRNCSPDSPQIGSVSLSPHSGWAMPSDVSYSLWVARAQEIEV